MSLRNPRTPQGTSAQQHKEEFIFKTEEASQNERLEMEIQTGELPQANCLSKPLCWAATNSADTSSGKQGGAPVGPQTKGFSEPSWASSMKAKLPKGLTKVAPPPPVHLHGTTKASAARAGVTQAPVGPCGDTAYHTLVTKAEK